MRLISPTRVDSPPSPYLSAFVTPTGQSHRFVSQKGGILLANLLQGSRSTFSCVSFSSFFGLQRRHVGYTNFGTCEIANSIGRVSETAIPSRTEKSRQSVVKSLHIQLLLNDTMTPYGATFLMITVTICPASSLSPWILMRSRAISNVNVNFLLSPHCSLPPGSTCALTRTQPPLNRPCG